jgi:hypothetical protein
MEQPITPNTQEGSDLDTRIAKAESDISTIQIQLTNAKHRNDVAQFALLQKVINTLQKELETLNGEKARKNLADIQAVSKKTQAELDEQYTVRNSTPGVVDWDAQGYDATKKRA